MKISDKRKLYWGVALLCLAGYVYYSFNPSLYAFFPPCPFRTLTGLPCPGCGSQRAIHCLLHLNVAGAFRQNALLVLSLPIVLLLLWAETVRTSKPQLYARIHRPVYIRWYAVAVMVWWIGRILSGQ